MRAALLGALAALFSTTAGAAVLTVTNNNDSGPGSLRAQVAASASGDMINFAAIVVGKIVLTSGQIPITHALTILGPGWQVLTIDGNGSDRIFAIVESGAPACPSLSGPSDYMVSISGLALANAQRHADDAGGAIVTLHSLSLDSVVIVDSAAKSGAGVSFHTQYSGQSLTINNSAFVDNLAMPLSVVTSPQQGGAVQIIERCFGTDVNTAIPATVTISNTLIAGNHAQPVAQSGRGGAIFAFAYADISITDSRIVGNVVDVPNPPIGGASYQGGAIRAFSKSLALTRVEVSDNGVVGVTGAGQTRGGAFFVLNQDALLQAPADAMVVKIVDSTISGNSVLDNAGAMLVNSNVAVEIDNSTISNNAAAPTNAGGIVVVSATTATPTLTLTSSILANSAPTTADLAVNAALDPYTVNAGHSLIENICTAGPPTCANVTVSGSGNLPQATDPQLGPLGFNGGLTRTHPPLAGSPVIDAGSNPLSLTYDQRKSPRVVGAAIDMGAFETVSLPTRLLIPDGTSIQQTFAPYPDTRWFAVPVEPGKTYVIEAADTNGDLAANAIGAMLVYDADGFSLPPPETNVDCTSPNGARPPAVDVNSDGIRCIVRTEVPTYGVYLNKRAVYVKVTRMDPAFGGGSQFKIRAREATVYGRWRTDSGYAYHVELENTTGDPMCVQLVGYPASGLTYSPATGWSGGVGIAPPLTVPAFGAVKTVTPTGAMVGGDTDGTFRVGACPSPFVQLIPGALHVSSYAFNQVPNTYVYYFTSTANEGKTRSTW